MFFFKISIVVSKENQDPNCKDLNTACPYWAERGFCKSRHDFMLEDCKLSCNACSIGKLCVIRRDLSRSGNDRGLFSSRE